MKTLEIGNLLVTIEGDLPKMEDIIADAWTIINTLHMAVMDTGEAWPRALEWLKTNEEFCKK